MLITQEMKQKIHRMVEDVEQRVSKALNEEIRRLSNLVDDFNLPFHPEPLVLNVYKKELHSHVESGLGSNLRARLSTALALNMEASQREMTERMEILIPERYDYFIIVCSVLSILLYGILVIGQPQIWYFQEGSRLKYSTA